MQVRRDLGTVAPGPIRFPNLGFFERSYAAGPRSRRGELSHSSTGPVQKRKAKAYSKNNRLMEWGVTLKHNKCSKQCKTDLNSVTVGGALKCSYWVGKQPTK